MGAAHIEPPSFIELPVNNSREAIIDNVRINNARGLPELQQLPPRDRPLIIVGGGPSLHDYLTTLRGFRPACDVLAVNGSYKFLRSVGIESDHFLLIDSRAENVTHVDAPGEETMHYLASQAHPNVFEALRDYAVTIFHLGTDATYEALKGTGEHTFSAGPIGMASVHAVYLGAALGYKNIFLFGYDFSQKGTTMYAYAQPLNAKDETLEIELDGKLYRTTLALARTADQFVAAISPLITACGVNIELYSDGLLPAMIRHADVLVPTEESEKAKYEAMWRQEPYRIVSPGMRSVEEATRLLGIKPGESVADLGCGLGRCAKWFQDQGFKAVGVDIASNALEHDVPFVQCALWDTEKLPKVDYGFSSDVLEHIPPDRVADTLMAIRDACRIGCYLNIDTVPDAFGVLVGERLHLSIHPAQWWATLLTEIWPHVQLVSETPNDAVFVCRK